MKKFLIAVLAVAFSLALVGSASATQTKTWVCHATGSESNPYVLIHVANVSAHIPKHEGDKLATFDENGRPTCDGDEEQPPAEKFDGALYEFDTIAAECGDGEVGVNGFTVTQVTYLDGEETDRQVVFTQEPTCVPLTPGPQGDPGAPGEQGPAGPAGQDGAAGANGANGSNGADGASGRDGKDGVSPSRCTSNRKFTLNIWADRGDKVRDLKAEMRGKALAIKQVSKRHWRVTFSMKGFKRGVYGVRVSATVNGKPERRVHIYRSCYGKGTGLNARTIVRL